MKAKLVILCLTLCALSAQPQATPKAAPPPAKPAVPVISDALKAKFFKAQLEMQAAQKAVKVKAASLQSTVGEITAACGGEFVPQMDANGDPVCVEKSKEVKKP